MVGAVWTPSVAFSVNALTPGPVPPVSKMSTNVPGFHNSIYSFFTCPWFFSVLLGFQSLIAFSLVLGFPPYLGRVARMGQHVRTCRALISATAHQVNNRLTSPRVYLAHQSTRRHAFLVVFLLCCAFFPGFYGVHCSESSNSCSSGSTSELCGHGRCFDQVGCQGNF